MDSLTSLFDDCWVGLAHVHIRRVQLYSMELRSIDSSACTYFLAFGICTMGCDVNVYRGEMDALYTKVLPQVPRLGF